MTSLGKRKNMASATSGGPKAQFKKPRQYKQKVQNIKAIVKAAMVQAAEKKFFDDVVTNQTPSTAAQIDSVVTMGGGSDESLRIGNQCQFVSTGYHFTGNLIAADTTGNSVRVILFIDRQSNAATATATAILQTDAFDAYYNMDNVDRFEILDDRIIDLPAFAGVAGTVVPQTVNVNVYKKLKDCKTSYASNAAVIPLTNNIGNLQIARNTAGNYRLTHRSRFVDP